MRKHRGRHIVLIPLIALGICAAADTRRSAAHAETTDSFDTTHTLVGSYLAGRLAKSQNDVPSAAEFYRSALTHDPANDLLLDQAFQMEASQANWPAAIKLAEELVALQPQHRMANLVLGLSDFKTGALKQAETRFRAAGSGPIGELTSALALAWVKLAENDVPQALALLDLPKQAEWAQFYVRYHRALVADIGGRTQEARTAFERAFRQDARTLRTSLAYARHAAAMGDRKLAASILKEHLDKVQGDGHPLIRALRSEIQSGGKIDLIVATPSQGMSEVFYGLGEALLGEGAVGIGILYMQLALYAEPGQQFALAALANAFETNKRYAEAITFYEKIPSDSPLMLAVEIRKAFNLNSLDRIDEARRTLTALLGPAPSADAAGKPDAAAAGPAPDIDVPDTIQSLGSQGEAVRTLQEALDALGHRIEKIDGKFGDETYQAVKSFQKEHGLEVDGLAGPTTFTAILEAKPGSASAGEARPDGKPRLTSSDKLEIYDALGSIMRAHKLYAEAVGYYDEALRIVGPKPTKQHWMYYYARGTSYERLKNWPAAETDLEKALSLYPDQPLILNYLGYSWIDQGRNMKQGMTLIEKAVALKPDDGYIVDSLGWAHYKQGNFKEAVRYLERAVELKPDDPVLNDHLGDALWKVGREREARFQWDQALSLKPEPEDLDKIRKKLGQGLSEEPGAAAATTKQAQTGKTGN